MQPVRSLVEIARLEERRQALGTKEVTRESIFIAGGVVACDGEGSWANLALGLGMDGPVDEADIDRLVAFFSERGMQPKVELCPYADETLVRGLATRGFVVHEFENVLARELPAGEHLASSDGLPIGLTIERVDPADPAAVTTFIEIASSGFRVGDAPMPAALIEVSSRIVQHPRCDSFLARIDGLPAGAGTVSVDDDLGALFGTSVLPAYRRRGVQSALMVRRMQHARDHGARLVTISSKPGVSTERNARRLGFFAAYTKAVLVLPAGRQRPG